MQSQKVERSDVADIFSKVGFEDVEGVEEVLEEDLGGVAGGGQLPLNRDF